MQFYGENITLEDLISKINAFDEKKLFQDLAKFLPQNMRKIIPDLKNRVIEKIKKPQIK